MMKTTVQRGMFITLMGGLSFPETFCEKITTHKKSTHSILYKILGEIFIKNTLP